MWRPKCSGKFDNEGWPCLNDTIAMKVCNCSEKLKLFKNKYIFWRIVVWKQSQISDKRLYEIDFQFKDSNKDNFNVKSLEFDFQSTRNSEIFECYDKHDKRKCSTKFDSEGFLITTDQEIMRICNESLWYSRWELYKYDYKPVYIKKTDKYYRSYGNYKNIYYVLTLVKKLKKKIEDVQRTCYLLSVKFEKYNEKLECGITFVGEDFKKC
uniref:Phlebovirus glycoprotein G2 fusion domain-containing protein n=1 Tax=Strongyloides papillosus TaxID=174720 RepID=A0A0N5BY62_STREA